MSQLYYGDTPLSQMPASYPASRVTHESVSVTGNGSKSYSTLLNELFALIDTSKMRDTSYLRTDGANQAYIIIAPFTSSTANPLEVMFSRDVIDNQKDRIDLYTVKASGSTFETVAGGTYTNKSNNTVANGIKLTLVY